MNTTPSKHESNPDAVSKTSEPKFRPLRIWPVFILLIGMAAARVLPTLAEDEALHLILIRVLGPVLMGVGVLIWWGVASRARPKEKIVGIVGALLAVGAAVACSHPSMIGPGTLMVAVPLGTLAFGVAAILCRNHLTFKRTWTIVLASACGFGFITLLRGVGMWGSGDLDVHWRWEASAEERMLAERGAASGVLSDKASDDEIDNWLAESPWPRFRGADGRSQQHGPEIDVDWESNPPELIWKTAIGPGWSSFVVAGNLLFTQEQLGDQEAVVCYAADSGQEVWRHEIESRWDDPLGGPGPRATPTLAAGRLFAQGALGQLQCLDPRTGDVVWAQDLRDIAGCKPPEWGFASSPLAADSVVVVHAGDGREIGRTVAFDVETGEMKWSVAAGNHSYSSPQMCTLAGQEYVVVHTNVGMNILQPDSGEEVLKYDWEFHGYRALQPQVVDGDSILMPTQEMGTRRVRITASEAGLQAEDLWTCRHLKPDFNDHVVHEGHLYGFDGMIMTCIDLATGERKWKGGRYGKGQVLMLSDSAVLLVASEKGEVVLVKADPDSHQEITKFAALEGRTWNHPVVVDDRLYIRNSQQAACYRLPLK